MLKTEHLFDDFITWAPLGQSLSPEHGKNTVKRKKEQRLFKSFALGLVSQLHRYGLHYDANAQSALFLPRSFSFKLRRFNIGCSHASVVSLLLNLFHV